jgi:NOL1/NOP2/sun family putative RNA methylase
MQCWATLPEKFLENIEELITDGSVRQNVLLTFCQKKPLAIRVNTLKATSTMVEKIFVQNNIAYEKVSWFEHGYILNESTAKLITSLEEYKQGHIYIQNLSSMIPTIVLNPLPKETVLDLCAAPGSKTTQMAMMMNNTGQIYANDTSKQRLYKLHTIIQQQGVTNIKTLHMPGEVLWKKFPNFFDKTLVDVPCTMEGRFHSQDPKTFEDWTPKKIKLLQHTQKWLLRSAVTATKPGGTIVYSTCTLSPEENEEVIDWLLKTETYPLEIEKITIPHLSSDKPLLRWKNKQYDERVQNCLRILPNAIMEGFFVTKIKKQNF